MQHKTKENSAEFPDVERDQWNAEEIADESVNQMPDEILRQMLRGDESSKSSADRSDIVGGSPTIDTPRGREEAKVKDKKS